MHEAMRVRAKQFNALHAANGHYSCFDINIVMDFDAMLDQLNHVHCGLLRSPTAQHSDQATSTPKRLHNP